MAAAAVGRTGRVRIAGGATDRFCHPAPEPAKPAILPFRGR
jgi:hypothetical protein